MLLGAVPMLLNAQPAQRVIRFVLQEAPGSAQHDAALRLAQIVKTRSGGQLQIKVVGGGAGGLGPDAAVLSALRGGTVEMAVLSTRALAGVLRQMSVFDLPFTFASEREARAVLDGPFGLQLLATLGDKGLVGQSFWDASASHFHCSTRPIERADDLQGQKIRATVAPLGGDFWAALGSEPVPVAASNLHAALEQKVVNCGTASIGWMLQTKLHGVQKVVTLSGHQMHVQVLLFSKSTWQSLSPGERQLLQGAASEARAMQRRLATERNAQALSELQAFGVRVNRLPAAEWALMKARTQAVIDGPMRPADMATAAALHEAITKVRAAD